MHHNFDKIWGIFQPDVLFMVMRVVLCGDIVRVFFCHCPWTRGSARRELIQWLGATLVAIKQRSRRTLALGVSAVMLIPWINFIRKNMQLLCGRVLDE
jgi:hypothetical protein